MPAVTTSTQHRTGVLARAIRQGKERKGFRMKQNTKSPLIADAMTIHSHVCVHIHTYTCQKIMKSCNKGRKMWRKRSFVHCWWVWMGSATWNVSGWSLNELNKITTWPSNSTPGHTPRDVRADGRMLAFTVALSQQPKGGTTRVCTDEQNLLHTRGYH